MYKVFTFVAALVCSMAVEAQTCVPEYTIQYAACADKSHPVQVQPFTSDWRTVIKGATGELKSGDCTDVDKIASVQAAFKGAANIREADKRTVNKHLRGLGKYDIQCRYSMDLPVNITMASPACGIAAATASCFTDIKGDFVNSCVNQQTPNLESMWKQAACLIDSRKNAAMIEGMSMDLIGRVENRLEVLKVHLHANPDPETAKLLKWIRANYR